MSLVACVPEAVPLLGEAYEFYYVVCVLVVASLPGVLAKWASWLVFGERKFRWLVLLRWLLMWGMLGVVG